jgi:hypothetical protein
MVLPTGYSILANGIIYGRTGSQMKTSLINSGYEQIECAGKMYRVHRLVCEAFHGPAPTVKAVVRHIDGNKLNNRADNLKWGSYADNWEDARKHGTKGPGEISGNTKLTEIQVLLIRDEFASGERLCDLGRKYLVTPENIGRIVRRETWQHI